MKTIIALLGLALLFSSSQGHAQASSSRETYPERSGQTWLTNYYGKTLSSLGDIVSVQIERHTSTSSTNRQHSAVWKIIEQSKIQDYYSMNVTGLPPGFTIKYADGMSIHASALAAEITLPDGRKDMVVLNPRSDLDEASPRKKQGE